MVWLKLLMIRIFDPSFWSYLAYEARAQHTMVLEIYKAEKEAEEWLSKNSLSNEELLELATKSEKNCNYLDEDQCLF
jgi:hypothetical protein